MKALTARQPYANAILYYGKDIENRSRKWRMRGTIVIQAAAKVVKDVKLPQRFNKPIVTSAIIAVVDIVDCMEKHKSKWFIGPFGYVLANPRPLAKPIPCKGQLGCWNVPPEVERSKDNFGENERTTQFSSSPVYIYTYW
jgi:hypothetical protein